MPHCKMYNPMMELIRARERVRTYGVPVSIGLRNTPLHRLEFATGEY